MLGGCFGGAELSPSGEGLPRASITFPDSIPPGAVRRAELTVANPGPGDIESLSVDFARVGAPAAQGLPNPIVDPGRGRDSGAVVDVSPRPRRAAPDVSYGFGPLPEGESVTLSFAVEVPEDPGVAANSVIVYDAADPGRAAGVRLETAVER